MKNSLLLVLFLALVQNSFSQESDKIESISIINLISNPENYHLKEIRITGFLNLKFEGNSIYLNKDDYENQNYKNGLWIEVSSDLNNKLIQDGANHKYVSITGIFNMNDKGHRQLWSGCLMELDNIRIQN